MLLLLAQTAGPFTIPPTPADGGGTLATWALGALVGALVLAVGELWRRRIADERTARADREKREEQEHEAANERLVVTREDAVSRVQLAEALRELSASNRELAAEVRARLPARPNGQTPAAMEIVRG
jgi:hypothetical protein